MTSPHEGRGRASQDLVAVVTGASRGVGRGIAQGLGEIGATVHLTGRSRQGQPSRGTIGLDGVAAEASVRGGTAVVHQPDQRDDAQVAAFFGSVLEREGRLDLLVNSAFGAPDPWVSSGDLWEHPVEMFASMLEVGVRSSYVARWHACRLMVPARTGMFVNVSARASRQYFFSAAYGMAKAETDKLSADLATELQPHGVCVVSLWPDLVHTAFYDQQVASGAWEPREDVQEPVDVGRAIARLVRSGAQMSHHGEAPRAVDLLEGAG